MGVCGTADQSVLKIATSQSPSLAKIADTFLTSSCVFFCLPVAVSRYSFYWPFLVSLDPLFAAPTLAPLASITGAFLSDVTWKLCAHVPLCTPILPTPKSTHSVQIWYRTPSPRAPRLPICPFVSLTCLIRSTSPLVSKNKRMPWSAPCCFIYCQASFLQTDIVFDHWNHSQSPTQTITLNGLLGLLANLLPSYLKRSSSAAALKCNEYSRTFSFSAAALRKGGKRQTFINGQTPRYGEFQLVHSNNNDCAVPWSIIILHHDDCLPSLGSLIVCLR